jgi:osmotically-inducible protein OsmY
LIPVKGILREGRIHIIVKHGDVALYGTVSSEADKTKAGMDARSVLGVHSVDNEIHVVRD